MIGTPRRPAAQPRFPFSGDAPSAPAIRRMLQRAYPRAVGASLTVHPDDDMYAFAMGSVGPEALSAMSYFRAGASMMDVIERIAQWRFGSLERVGSCLDFAAGYGRSTRFLVRYLSPDRVTVGEIQEDALRFQAAEFGVATLHSTTDPGAFTAPRAYDFVFVASLFTHLPRRTFGPWLAKLWEMVAPGGVLVFSSHDEVLEHHGVEWEDGFAFLNSSEVTALDIEEYGTNFTTDAFVRAQLAEWIGADADRAIRLPHGLCFQQDLWVVTRGTPTEDPLVFENGPNGALDWLEVDERGDGFQVGGWAGDRGFAALDARSHAIDRVEISLSDGTAVDAELGLPRPDIASHLGRPGDPRLELSGWSARGRAQRALRLDDIVTVTAFCEQGGRFVLDSTRVLDMLTRTGGALPPLPVQRRVQTAKSIYFHRGIPGLIELAPAVASNEWRRLGRALRRYSSSGGGGNGAA